MKKLLIMLLMSPLCSSAQLELQGNFIKATGSGGQPPYQYSLNNIVYQSNDSFTCLSPGLYTLYIKDSRGILATESIRLYAPLNLVATSVTTSSISVIGVDGKPPYSYSRNSTTRWQSVNVFTGLRRRTTYTIRVKDNANYIKSLTIRTL
jgi:hypothetical protein